MKDILLKEVEELTPSFRYAVNIIDIELDIADASLLRVLELLKYRTILISNDSRLVSRARNLHSQALTLWELCNLYR